MDKTGKISLGIVGGIIGLGIILTAASGLKLAETNMTTPASTQSAFETTQESVEILLNISAAKSTLSAAQPTAGETTAACSFTLVSLTTPVTAGDFASIALIGEPDTEYDINVYYASGKSSAVGLENKKSNGTGYIIWTWKVGANTTPGHYHINVIGGGCIFVVKFTVK